MGSDLFESYAGSIISAITLAAVAVANADETAVFSTTTAAVFPLIISAIGILASVIGIMIVRGKDGGNPASALNMGTYVSGIIVIIATVILSKTMLGDYTYAIAIIAGLVVGIAIGKITEVILPVTINQFRKLLTSLRQVLQLQSSVASELE
mgnify:CR=1 FL=1